MLARLTSGIALASMAALVLVGCAPEEPSIEDLTAEVEATFDGFQHVVSEQLSAGSASSAALEEYATPELAQTWATDLQDFIDSGYSSTGLPVITNVELQSQSPMSVETRLCTDGSGIETLDATGSTIAPVELVAWEADFERSDADSALLLATLEPTLDDGVCGG